MGHKGALAEQLMHKDDLALVLVDDDIVSAVNRYNLAGQINARCIVATDETGQNILLSVHNSGQQVQQRTGGS